MRANHSGSSPRWVCCSFLMSPVFWVIPAVISYPGSWCCLHCCHADSGKKERQPAHTRRARCSLLPLISLICCRARRSTLAAWRSLRLAACILLRITGTALQTMASTPRCALCVWCTEVRVRVNENMGGGGGHQRDERGLASSCCLLLGFCSCARAPALAHSWCKAEPAFSTVHLQTQKQGRSSTACAATTSRCVVHRVGQNSNSCHTARKRWSGFLNSCYANSSRACLKVHA